MKDLLLELRGLPCDHHPMPPDDERCYNEYLNDVVVPMANRRAELAMAIADRAPVAAWKEARLLLRVLDALFIGMAFDTGNMPTALSTFGALERLQVRDRVV